MRIEGLRVKGWGFRIHGLGLRVSGFRVQDYRFRTQGLGYGV